MLTRIPRWFRSLLLRRRLDREMRDEMQAHIDRATERLRARGLSLDEARRAARREFGNVDYLQEQGRDARGGRWVEAIAADARFAWRHFSRIPFSTATIVLVLALGISVNVVFFGFLHSMNTLPPMGMQRNESLVRIRGLYRGPDRDRTGGRSLSYPEVQSFARSGAFRAVAAWTGEQVVFDFGKPEEGAVSGAATYVTDDYFRVLGISPAFGPGLPVGAADDGTPPLVGLISHPIWDMHYGRDPAVIGKTLNVNGTAVTIVGVAPPRFLGPSSGLGPRRVWLPLAARPLVEKGGTRAALASYDSLLLQAAALLHDNRNREQATALVRELAGRAAKEMSGATGMYSADVVPVLPYNARPDTSNESLIITVLFGLLAVLILLVTCTNVSALLVGIAVARRREIAVRLSLGATRVRLLRQLVTESVCLAFAAGLLGLFVLSILLRAVSVHFDAFQLAIQWQTAAFSFAVALVTGLAFGLSPALHATRLGLSEVLKDTAGAVSASRSWLQRGLVVAQIALTQPLLTLLVALVAVIVTEARGRRAADLSEHIALFHFNWYSGGRSVEQRSDEMRRLQERIEAIPGVAAVLPRPTGGFSNGKLDVHPSDRPPGLNLSNVRIFTELMAPGYLRMMEIPLVRGRDFTANDREAEAGSIIIGSDLARRIWGSADPIGKRMTQSLDGNAGVLVVVGVVDPKQLQQTENENTFRIYTARMPASDSNRVRATSLYVRTHGPAQSMLPLIRSVVRSEVPTLPISNSMTLAQSEERSRQNRWQAASWAGAAGSLALLLSAIALYAVTSFAVTQRKREVGIRTALGANSQQVVGMFFRTGIRLSLCGLAIGLPLGFAGLRMVSGLVGMPATSSAVVAAVVSVGVIAVAAFATWIPARRAADVDPLHALRTE